MRKKYTMPELEVLELDVKLDVINASNTGDSVDVGTSGNFAEGNPWE